MGKSDLLNGWRVVWLALELRIGRREAQNLTLWEVMSWWWFYDNELAPQVRLSDELERIFSPEPALSFTTSGSLGIGTVAPSTRLSITSTSKSGPPAGTWEWEGIRIELDNSPNPLRRVLLSSLLGAKWLPNSQTKKSSPTLYEKLLTHLD